MMKTALTSVALAALPMLATSQAELNRIDLNNGGDILWFISTPYIGSDPVNGNFNGDFYWKVYPDHVVQRAAGAATVWGVEMNIFDLDWTDFAPLWAYLITTSTPGTDLNLEPDLNTTGPGVLVPQLDNSGLTSPTPSVCPKPGYTGGWILSDLFADTVTGSLIPLMQQSDSGSDDYFTANGTVDWAFVHFFPGNNQSAGPQDVFQPSPNGCGSGFSGSASFQWFGSADGVAPFGDGGENAGHMTIAPDGAGTGGTVTGTGGAYGGFQVGGNGAPGSGLIPEVQSGGADLEFLFQGASLNLAVNTGYTVVGVIAPEIGTAGLHLPIGWDTASGAPALKDSDGGVPGSTSVTFGVAIYDQSASTVGFADPGLPNNIGVYSGNIDFPGGALDLLIDQFGCFPVLGGNFCLNPANPIFSPLFNASLLEFQSFGPDPVNGGERVYKSSQIPIAPEPCLLGVTIGWQGWNADLQSSMFVDSTNVVRTVLTDNSNVQ